MNNALIWARHPDGKRKSLADMSDDERKNAKELCALSLFAGKGQDVAKVKAFIEDQTFKAEERLAEGPEMNEDGTDFA